MGNKIIMKLEEILLKPEETMILAIDVQNDFLRAEKGFVFFDAGVYMGKMQSTVVDGIIPLLTRSSDVHIGLVKAEYQQNQFQKPFDFLCTGPPGTDFYFLNHANSKAKAFTKNEHDPFSNPQLAHFIDETGIQNLIIAGFTLTNCIRYAVTSAIQMPNLKIIIPEDCVGYRRERESDAKAILESYKSQNARRIIVVGSQINIKYGN